MTLREGGADPGRAGGWHPYRLLLRLYPRSFRARHGEELVETLREMRAEPRYAVSHAGRLRFWLALLKDLPLSGLRVRLRALPGWLRDLRPGASHNLAGTRTSRMDILLHDLRQAARLFKLRPVLVGLAAASFALAIAGTVTLFTVLNAVVLRPFPYPDPDRLVAVGVAFPRVDADRRYIEALSPAEVEDIRRAQSLEKVGAFDLGNRTLSGGTRPAERVFTALVLSNLFDTIGMQPFLGRDFLPGELRPGGPPAAIISHRVWSSQFGADLSLVGRAVRVNGVTTTVVGVMPPGLLVIGADLWIPWGGDPGALPRQLRQFTLLARLRPGVSRTQANAELATIAAGVTARFGGEHKEYVGWQLVATPWAEALSADFRTLSFAMFGAVGLVLLVACANVANLLVAHAASRQREIAVRLALGSGRLRLARQFIFEGLLIAACGGALALPLSVHALASLTSVLPDRVAMLGVDLHLNGRVLLFGVLVAFLSGTLCGLIPSVRVWGVQPQDWLQAAGPTATGSPRGGRVRRFLVVAEIAVSLALLAVAGLFARTTAALVRVDPGLASPANVLTMRLTLPREEYRGEAVAAFFDELTARVGRLPGVESVGAVTQFPPAGFFRTRFNVVGRETSANAQLPSANATIASPGAFRTLGVPLRAGRLLADTDRAGTPAVALVNETFAKRFLRGVNPIGQRLAIGDGDGAPTTVEVVGVVGDTRNAGLREAVTPEVFLPVHQNGGVWNQLFLLVRGAGDPLSLLPAIRREVAALDPDQPIYAIQTIEDAMAASILQQRLALVFLSLYAVLTLMLASLGIYGVVSQAVTARTREIGVRMAFGARRTSVMSMLLGDVLRLVAVGWLLGMGLALGLGRVVAGLLHRVTPTDPITLGVVSAVLALAAVLAAAAPAVRASRLHPMAALRHE